MRIILKNGDYTVTEEFPKDSFALLDMLDRLRQPGSRTVKFSFEGCTDKNLVPSELYHRGFVTDIFALNVFAERLENMSLEENAAYWAVVKENQILNFEDAFQMTFGLKSVPVVCAWCFSELGEFAVENQMLPEIEDCPDELLELLDTAKLGRLMCERDEGIFIDGYYCEPSAYQKPDIQVEIGKPEPCFFRLLLTPDAERPGLAEWISLPCDASVLKEKICLESQSSLPNLLISQRPEEDELMALNRTAERLSGLNQQEFLKLKVVMEYEDVRNIAGVFDCISHLNEYDFDPVPSGKSEFGLRFLTKTLPPDFCEAFRNIDLTDFGGEILHRKAGKITGYGALSGRGQKLYSRLNTAPEQNETEEESEECDMKMGGM